MDMISHSGFEKCIGKQPKGELSKNINKDIDFSKVGGVTCLFGWNQKWIHLNSAHAKTIMG